MQIVYNGVYINSLYYFHMSSAEHFTQTAKRYLEGPLCQVLSP